MRVDAVMRVDKATGAQTPVTPPIDRAVSAIDLDGTTLYVGTRTTRLTGGWWPTYDGFESNFVAAFDGGSQKKTISSELRDVGGIAHDDTHLYWTQGGAVWRRARAGDAVERFATIGGETIAVDDDAVWGSDSRGVIRIDKKSGSISRIDTGSYSPSIVSTAAGDLFLSAWHYDRDDAFSRLRVSLPRVWKDYGSIGDTPLAVAGSWVVYDESVWIDPWYSWKGRHALNLCDPAPPANLWGTGYATMPPADPIPIAPPTAVDACGIFVGTERKVCFAAQALSIDNIELYLDGLVRTPAIRSTGGDLVLIFGHGFDATTTVGIDGQPAPVMSWTETALSVSAPKVVPGKPSVSVPMRVRNGSGDCTAQLITINDPHRRAAGH